jgi:hypothetical protein
VKVYILYRPKSEHSTKVTDYLHDFVRAHPAHAIRVLDIDSKEGTNMARLYDIIQYPGVIALTEDGQLLRSWQGDLPLINELGYYTQS